MAKMTITIENGQIKRELEIGGKTLSYTMLPTTYGMKSDSPCFEEQIKELFPDLYDYIEEYVECEYCFLEDIDSDNVYEINDFLESILGLEK